MQCNTEAILSNSTRKMLRFEITKMLTAVFKKLRKKLLRHTVQFSTHFVAYGPVGAVSLPPKRHLDPLSRFQVPPVCETYYTVRQKKEPIFFCVHLF